MTDEFQQPVKLGDHERKLAEEAAKKPEPKQPNDYPGTDEAAASRAGGDARFAKPTELDEPKPEPSDEARLGAMKAFKHDNNVLTDTEAFQQEQARPKDHQPLPETDGEGTTPTVKTKHKGK